eukprot:5990459-Amphidinium_carterae.1
MAWNLGCEILKLDLTKAYDSVGFVHLSAALRTLGASAGMVAAVLRLLCYRQYVVEFQGAVSSVFRLTGTGRPDQPHMLQCLNGGAPPTAC